MEEDGCCSGNFTEFVKSDCMYKYRSEYDVFNIYNINMMLERKTISDLITK